jgi:hypothetical protein
VQTLREMLDKPSGTAGSQDVVETLLAGPVSRAAVNSGRGESAGVPESVHTHSRFENHSGSEDPLRKR